MSDGQRRNDVQTFVHWQERETDCPTSRAPLPEDWWVSERQAMLRDMQTPKRRYLRAALKLCALVGFILLLWWRW